MRNSLAFARWRQHWTALEETSSDDEADEQSDSDWQLAAELDGTVAQVFVLAAVVVGVHQ